MRRDGFVGPMLAITLILVAIILMTVMSGLAEPRAGEEIRGHLEEIYADNVLGEEVLSAPCATISRGVFRKGAVVSGSFNCTRIRRPLNVRFNVSHTLYDWVLRQPRTEVKAIKPDEPQTFSHSYSVLVYDSVTGEYIPAKLEVGER